jgi:hypothetical protein
VPDKFQTDEAGLSEKLVSKVGDKREKGHERKVGGQNIYRHPIQERWISNFLWSGNNNSPFEECSAVKEEKNPALR